MTTATILSWALFTAAPEPQQPQPAFKVTSVDVDRGSDSTTVLALDDGEVVAEIVVWRDAAATARIDVNFADGLAYLSVTGNGETPTVETDNADLVHQRMLMIQAALSPEEGDEWIPCAAAAGTAVLDCVLLNPILCGLGTFIATCECLDLAVPGETSCWD
jgi:hypothetical protein